MFSKKKLPAADSALDTSSDLLAELAEQQAEQAQEAEALPQPERVELAHGTLLETNTVYEDRTSSPEVAREVEYETEETALDSGTILTNVLGAKSE